MMSCPSAARPDCLDLGGKLCGSSPLEKFIWSKAPRSTQEDLFCLMTDRFSYCKIMLLAHTLSGQILDASHTSTAALFGQ